MGFITEHTGLMIGLIVAAVAAVIAIIVSGYVKAPPDKAYIISGIKKTPKILIGRAGIKLPFLERKDTLVLKQISIDIKTNGYVPTLDFIGVDIDAVAKVRLKTDPEGIKIAMKNFLNMSEEAITKALTDSLQGNMREIIGTLSLKSINTDRDSFSDQVMAKAAADAPSASWPPAASIAPARPWSATSRPASCTARCCPTPTKATRSYKTLSTSASRAICASAAPACKRRMP